MNSIATWGGAIALVMIGTFYPQNSRAETFTGTQFLQWSEAAQDSYFQTSITMASIMATKTRKASGDCIAAWYLAPEADRAARNIQLRNTITRNDAYHPSAVIFLVLEQECGPFAQPAS